MVQRARPGALPQPALTRGAPACARPPARPRRRIAPARASPAWRLGHRDLQLLSEAAEPFTRRGWIWELKYDGFRVLALVRAGRVRLLTRRGSDLADAFPEISVELAQLPDCAIDAELTVLDSRGVPQFDALAARARNVARSAIDVAARERPAALLAFDLLALEGDDLRDRPLSRRKGRLAGLVAGLQRTRAVSSIEHGSALFAEVVKLGLEGVVGKDASAPYRAGRHGSWIKVKTAAGRRATQRRGDSWYGGPKRPRLATHPYRDACEALMGAREGALHLEIDGHALRLTHLERVLWPQTSQTRPAISKRDYLAYLLQAAPAMLPHLRDRPLTLLLMHEGIGGPRRLEMHWSADLPACVDTVAIHSSNTRGDHRYLVCNNAAALLWLANAGVLEFHPWLSRVAADGDAAGRSTRFTGSVRAVDESVLNFPDYLFFDLDSYYYSGRERGREPDYTDEGFAHCRTIARQLAVMLKAASLQGFVKTSGRTGLHVLAPIERSVDFGHARRLAREVAQHLVHADPNGVTLDSRVERRRGKVFIDVGMNRRAASLAAPYGPRAVAGAPVSMPLAWSELAGAHPQDFDFAAALSRLQRAGDPWQDLLRAKRRVA